MIEYRLTQSLEVNLRILAAELSRMSKEYAEKEGTKPLSPINTEMQNEHRSGNFQGKSEAYGYSSRELTKLLKWYGIESD